ncbi:MAG: HAD-IA family hydrolase [Gammaproteobacteria bacterium]
MAFRKPACSQAKPVFERVYSTINGRYSQLYPGVVEGLESLRQLGSTLACITNKPALFTQPLLHTLGLSHFFSLILSGDSLARKKPDPLPLLHAASTFGVKPEQCLMIGDSRHDVDAARAAGIAVIAVSYGYNHGQPIAQARPDGIVDSLLELPRYFECNNR